MIKGKVLFVHKEKLIVTVFSDSDMPENKGKLIHLLRNSKVPIEIEKGVWISTSGVMSEKEIKDLKKPEAKIINLFTPDSFQINTKSVIGNTNTSSQRTKNKLEEEPKKHHQFDKKLVSDEKLVISAEDRHLFKVGEIKTIKNERVKINHIGRVFESSKGKQMICFVYYEKAPVTGDDFMKATRDYYAVIDFIKKNGIKPRHKPEMITQIKNAKIICDSRKKLEGNAWLAYNDEFMWYISYKLSPITLDNNIKIFNQMAQCWRISIRNIRPMMEEIQNIEEILFKSDIIPSLSNT